MKKSSIITVPAAFTDHLAVILRLTIESHTIQRGRGSWEMKTATLAKTEIKQKLQQWGNWKRLKQHYPNNKQWWGRLIKKKIRQLYKQEERERYKDTTRLENHYYECLYDVIAQNIPYEEKLTRLNKTKAKIVKINSEQLQTIITDTDQNDRMKDEPPTLYHILQTKKKRLTQRSIQLIEDDKGDF